MDGVFRRSGSVTGSVFYDVASCHKRKLLALEDLFKSCKVGRVGDIYRNIVGENINIFFENKDKLEATRMIVNEYDDANITSSVPNNIEIGGVGSSKSKAISELLRILSIDRSDLLCCGDAANDIPMIELAGVGVAMENAWDIVKAHADYVTDTNVNGGVGKAILKFCFGEDV